MYAIRSYYDRCHTSNHKGFEKLSMETLLQYNPDVILVQEKEFYERIYTLPTWQHVKAVQNKRVYFIPKSPFNWFDRPPSFMRILGLQWLMIRLYPDVYQKDLVATTKRVITSYSIHYTKLYEDCSIRALNWANLRAIPLEPTALPVPITIPRSITER